jgi:Transglycosylase-like domain
MLSRSRRPHARAIVLSLISLCILTAATPSFASPAPHNTGRVRTSSGAAPFEWHVPRHHPRLTLARVARLGGVDWIAIARCESGLRWHVTASPYYGGLQFLTSTWLRSGGGKYARRADLARPAEQIVIAYRLKQRAGLGQWPVCGGRG